MLPSDIFQHIKQKPFRPFRVYLSDGSSLLVPDEFMARVEVTQLWIGLDPEDAGLPTRSLYIAPHHVTRIEPLPVEPSSKPSDGNGRP